VVAQVAAWLGEAVGEAPQLLDLSLRMLAAALDDRLEGQAQGPNRAGVGKA
jgi:hypothetical protein